MLHIGTQNTQWLPETHMLPLFVKVHYSLAKQFKTNPEDKLLKILSLHLPVVSLCHPVPSAICHCIKHDFFVPKSTFCALHFPFD